MAFCLKKQMKKEKINQLFIWCTITMMLPFPIACIGILVSVLVCLREYSFIDLIKYNKIHQVIHFIVALSMLTSILNRNIMGVGVTIALYILYMFAVYYAKFVTRYTFEKIVKCMLMFSVVHAIYAVFENLKIIPSLRYDFISPKILVVGDGRAASFFLHPNYYAMICGFFILLAWYKIYLTLHKRGILFYSLVIIANLGGLFATQTRTAWPVIFVSFIICLLIIGARKMRFYVSSLLIAGTIALPFYQNLPRFDLQTIFADMWIRIEIWQVSFEHLIQHWLIGTGPLTYMMIFEKYNSYPTQHAHNIILDILICLGVVGFIAFIPVFKTLYRMIRTINVKNNRVLYALCTSCLSLVVLYGTIDVTILWVQTFYIFVLIMLAPHNVLKEDTILIK